MSDKQEFKTPLDKWTYERIKHLLVPGDKKLDEEFQFPAHDLKQVPLVRQTNDITPQTISIGRYIKPQEAVVKPQVAIVEPQVAIAISRDLEKSISTE